MPEATDAAPPYDDLRASLQGTMLLPGDDGYNEARGVWNGVFDPRPVAIVRCRAPDDVVAAINFARQHRLPLSVRGGGHSYAGHSVKDNALALDLSLMDRVTVDPDGRRASVEAGATWADVDAATQAHGLATTGGTVSSVGVAGFTLGGGTGYLARKYGLAADNLMGADVVTADGRLVRASSDENQDLLWALRGGGGNFGVVTAFELRLHEVGPDVVMLQAFHSFDDAPRVLRFYRDFMDHAPDEVNVYAFMLRTPPVEPFPQKYHGQVAVALVGCHCGPVAGAEMALKPLAEFGQPFLAAVQRTAYTAAQQAFDAGMPKGLRWYSRFHYLKALPDSAIDTVLRFTESLPGEFTMAYFERGGGAADRVARDAVAFPHRDPAYGIHIFPGWTEPADDARMREWARQFHDAMAEHATGGVYVNMLASDEAERVPAAYGANYDRLVALKRVWDPDNLFSSNHNIPPQR